MIKYEGIDIMNELINVIIIAVGLSMDAFSLAMLYGTLNFDQRKTLTLAGAVGVFHFFMPLLGNLIGLIILSLLPIKPNAVVGIIFMMISIQMLLSSFKEEEIVDLKGIIAIILFAFTVSIDSFSVGITLSFVARNYLLSVSIFSIVSFLFTYIGLSIGGKLTQKFGKWSTIMGGIILFFLSIAYLFFYKV